MQEIFTKFTLEALKHGTAKFFQGLLGAVASLIFLAYTKHAPDSVRLWIEYTLFAFFVFSMGYTAFAMIFGGERPTKVSDQGGQSGLPDLREEMAEDFASRIRDWAKDYKKFR